MLKHTFGPSFQEEAEASGSLSSRPASSIEEFQDNLVYRGVPGQLELLSETILGKKRFQRLLET